MRSLFNPIHPSSNGAPAQSMNEMMKPLMVLRRSAIAVTCSIFGRLPAPRYCEQSTDVPMFIIWKMRNAKVMSWFATPTAATASSANCESMNVSVAPMSVTRRSSMKIGSVSERTFLRRLIVVAAIVYSCCTKN